MPTTPTSRRRQSPPTVNQNPAASTPAPTPGESMPTGETGYPTGSNYAGTVAPEKDPRLEAVPNLPKTFFERAKNPSFFGELDVVDPNSVPPASAWQGREYLLDALFGSAEGQDRLSAGMLTGRVGSLQAARFLDRPDRLAERTDFHAARGEQAFRNWLAADELLRAVPRGQLSQRLDGALLEDVARALGTKPRGNSSWAVLGDKLGLGARAPSPLGLTVQGGGGRRGTNLTGVDRQGQSVTFSQGDFQTLQQDGRPGSATVTIKVGEQPPRPATADELREAIAATQRFLQKNPTYDRSGYVEAVPSNLLAGLAALGPQMATDVGELFAWTRAALDAKADPFDTAAQFQKRFLELRPLASGVGEAARLLSDRILVEHGILPPLMKQFYDGSVGVDELRQEIANGSWRMSNQLGNYFSRNYQTQEWEPPEDYNKANVGALTYTSNDSAYGWGRQVVGSYLRAPGTNQPGVAPAFATSPPLTIAGMKYTLAADGFVYDIFGRPHLFNARGELEPLSQMFFYTAMRRLAQAPDAVTALDRFTSPSREAFTRLADSRRAPTSMSPEALDPALRDFVQRTVQEGFPLRQAGQVSLEDVAMWRYAFFQDPARLASLDGLEAALKALRPAAPLPDPVVRQADAAGEADASYQALLPALGREQILSLFDLTGVNPFRLFLPLGNAATESTKASFAMSAYAQLDLDFWRVQKAFERTGDKAGAAGMVERRRALFDLAKKHLAEYAANPTRATSENPLGFVQQHEAVMYQYSPLRFDTFDQARKAGDDRLVVFHGGMGFIAAIGLHPNDQPQNPDAFELSAQLFERGVTRNLFASLSALSGSALGNPELCTTTDLGLLAADGSFAARSVSGNINLQALPRPVAEALRRRLDKPGETISLSSLGDVARLAAGTLPELPPNHVDISGLAPELIRQAFEDVTLYVSSVGNEDYTVTQARAAQLKSALVDQLCLAAEHAADAGGGNAMQSFLRGNHTFIDLEPILGADTASQLYQVREPLNRLRALVSISRNDDPNNLQVTLYRRAFAISLPKEGALTSTSFGGGGSFEYEQEIHGLRSVWTNSVVGQYSRDELARPLGDLTREQLKWEHLPSRAITADNPMGGVG